ncbi:Cell division protein FtsA [hydrothermal vent metagenome]|uniref:Cell division protein FtsA n=1 Tax=hydrothermal vent metagenome TaxID=652676 RepID=A0A3B0SHM7_9ZZZZ
MNVVSLHGNRPGGRGNGPQKSGIIAALDVGSTKVCCLIAKIEPPTANSISSGTGPKIKILGVGHHAARGIRAGAVANVEEAERSIRLAVDAAERMAQVSVGEVYVNVAGGQPSSICYSGAATVQNEVITQNDVNAAIGAAMVQSKAAGRVLLHASPVQYSVDDAKGVKDPIGMYGVRLGVEVNAVLVEQSAMHNLAMVIERCHLNIAGFVIAPYAAGRSVLVDDEMELGTTLIDMGGATTSVAVFHDGNLIYGDVLPIGGHHVTKDLARGLSTTIAHAERMKTLYGSALPSIYDDRELISVPILGERGVDALNSVPRSMLTGIIRPRLEEIFEMVQDRLEQSPVANKLGRQLVLCGGASQLTGMREAAGQIMSRNIRMASPGGLSGLPESSKSPAFSVATGLLAYALEPDQHMAQMIEFSQENIKSTRYINRVGRWIKESF